MKKQEDKALAAELDQLAQDREEAGFPARCDDACVDPDQDTPPGYLRLTLQYPGSLLYVHYTEIGAVGERRSGGHGIEKGAAVRFRGRRKTIYVVEPHHEILRRLGTAIRTAQTCEGVPRRPGPAS